jgi:hypothetical protein
VKLDGSVKVLSWSPSLSATSYDVYVDGAMQANVAVSRYHLTTPLTGGSHAWQVVARNGLTSVAGPVWTFQTPVAVGLAHATATLGQMNGIAVSDGAVTVYAGGEVLDASTPYATLPSGEADVYDARTGRWATRTLPQAREGVVGATAGRMILLGGGVLGNNVPTPEVDLYDTRRGRWSRGSLSLARTEIGALGVGSRAIFYGGFIPSGGGGGGGTTSGRIDLYDARTGRWTATSLPKGYDVKSATAVGGKVVFLNDDGEARIYDLASGRWAHHALSVSRANVTALAVGQVLVLAGGTTFDADGTARDSDAVDIYDAGRLRWRTARLSEARSEMTAIAQGGRFGFFAGGRHEGQPYEEASASDAVDVFDVQTRMWTAARLSEARTGMAAATSGDAVIFAGGGFPDAIASSDAVDMYDVSSGTWSARELSEPRLQIAVASVGDGNITRQVLFGGGSDYDVFTGSNESATVDVYDVASGQWSVSRLSEGGPAESATAGGEGLFFASPVNSGTTLVDVYEAGV